MESILEVVCRERGWSEFMSNRERISLTLIKHWKILVLLFVFLGVSTVLPIGMGRPNFFGFFTLCSFAPIATIAMFILALTVYLFVNKRKLLLYGNVFLLLVIVGFTGFWVYDAKLPMDNIRVDMSIYNYYFGYSRVYEENISKIFFNLVLQNTLMRDTPAFWVEYYDFYVEGKKLEFYTYDVFPGGIGGWYAGIKTRWIGSDITLEPNQTMTLEVEVTLSLDYTKVEGDTIEDVWTSLSNKNFTFRMDGILVSRRYYGPEYTDYYIVWGSTRFSIAYRYTE